MLHSIPSRSEAQGEQMRTRPVDMLNIG